MSLRADDATMTDHDGTIDTEESALLAEVAVAPRDEPVAERSETGPSLHFGNQVFALKRGDNVVGRGNDADVQLASSSVSRRHARIRIAPEETLLEDLQSRNGTVARDDRIVEPTLLNDGDAVRFGVVWLVYRASSSKGGSR